jgi:UDP-N-acetylmuramoyl-tripeptide--D-alanyl-D-alanine ligase
MKPLKRATTRYLQYRTTRYLNKTHPKIVVIAGSIGKTSSTQAIGRVLGEKFGVITTRHNYNTPSGVIMSIFGYDTKTTTLGWLAVSLKILVKSFGRPAVDIYVLEVGTDGPGQLKDFAYLHPDIAVVTGVTPEHMEFFKDLESVAKEELSVSDYSNKVLINADLVSKYFVETYTHGTECVFYGAGREYAANLETTTGRIRIDLSGSSISSSEYQLIGMPGLAVLSVSAAVATMLGMNEEEIQKALLKLQPVAGRMSKLKGINDSTIIDDTYNASPEAVIAALDYIYQQTASKRIALLGMMNELGEQSPQYHRQIGEYCDPRKLDLVVTLGQDANSYLAESAEKRGCMVIRTDSPIEAAEVIEKYCHPGTLILAKGSQNGVYAEEAVKYLLANPEDKKYLVRQHDYWPAKKAKQFPDLLTT